jgi:aspartyl-tRNA(Asn)/glutamyl-tRNA(Gln) amidotransferase subunit A
VLADWHRWSLVEAAQRLRNRQLSAVELVDAVLARIAEREGEVRAFLTVTAELARRQAVAAQRVLDRDGPSSPPLTGIRVALKDLIDVRGCHTTAASKALADNVARSDAVVWRQMARAGATLVGKVNTHEFADGGATEPTRNPWDTSRMVGGSSGRSAAALAAGMCFGVLGTDTAGSVRISRRVLWCRRPHAHPRDRQYTWRDPVISHAGLRRSAGAHSRRRRVAVRHADQPASSAGDG